MLDDNPKFFLAHAHFIPSNFHIHIVLYIYIYTSSSLFFFIDFTFFLTFLSPFSPFASDALLCSILFYIYISLFWISFRWSCFTSWFLVFLLTLVLTYVYSRNAFSSMRRREYNTYMCHIPELRQDFGFNWFKKAEFWN